jgi:hypothetical protein
MIRSLVYACDLPALIDTRSKICELPLIKISGYDGYGDDGCGDGGYGDDGYGDNYGDDGYGDDNYCDDHYGYDNDRFDGYGNDNNGYDSNDYASRDSFHGSGTSKGYSQSSGNGVYSSPNTTSFSHSQISRGQEASVSGGGTIVTFDESKPGKHIRRIRETRMVSHHQKRIGPLA